MDTGYNSDMWKMASASILSQKRIHFKYDKKIYNQSSNTV